MKGHIDGRSISDYSALPAKQILPSRGKCASLIIDYDYLAHLQSENGERIDLILGNEDCPFNVVKFENCEVRSVRVRSVTVFAHTVIIDDSSFCCEQIYFNLKNELEFKSGKMRFSTMKVLAKWVNMESSTFTDGNHLIVTASKLASFSGELNIETHLYFRSPTISISKTCSISAGDILLIPTESLDIDGSMLRARKLFIGDFCDSHWREAVMGTANVRISGKVKGDKLSILTSGEVVLSGTIIVSEEMDCLGKHFVKVEECFLKSRQLRVHSLTCSVDTESVLEGAQCSFMIENKVEFFGDLSSLQFDKSLIIECSRLVSRGVGVGELIIGDDVDGQKENNVRVFAPKYKYRSGDVSISTTESIELGGVLKCKQLVLNCQRQQPAAGVIIRENAHLDVDSLVVTAAGLEAAAKQADGPTPSPSSSSNEVIVGDVLFENGSTVICSLFLAIETEKNVIIKGILKRTLLCYSTTPTMKLSIKTSRSIKFEGCSVDVGEAQLLFGEALVLHDRANVYTSGNIFLVNHNLLNNNRGVLRLANDCTLVARKDVVCQFDECYVEGTLASEEASVLLGHYNNNTSQNSTIIEQQQSKGNGKKRKKELKLNQVIKKVVRSLKLPSKPIVSLLREKSRELVDNFQRSIRLKGQEKSESTSTSFVMKYIFISGEIRAKKTAMLVSRDISIQNGSSIHCTSKWDSTAILIYSNRSYFQCSSKLDASTILIVSPIVVQLLSLIKAHNLSISAAVVFRLACLYNSTKTILKSPLILSGLSIVAPNVSKTLHKMRGDLVDNCVDVLTLIERLAEAREVHREFEVFLTESFRLFKKHTPSAILHSLELIHFVAQIVNLLVPKTALFITTYVMSIIRAALFLLFGVKNIQKSIKKYLKSERHNFILVEIVGEGIFATYQVVGVVSSFMSLYNQIKLLSSTGIGGSLNNVHVVPSLKDLPKSIINRTKDLLVSSNGRPLPSTLSNVLGLFDTFVLNDYTKYAVGLFSYIPSSMSFSILNFCSGDVQLGMYIVNNSSACSINGSVVVLSYNCSSTDLVSFNTRNNIVICNGSISESSVVGKVDRGMKISQRSLVLLAGSKRVHEGGYHFGESVVLKTKRFEQRQNNQLIYNRIGGLSINEWELLHRSKFRPLSSSSESHSPLFSSTTMSGANRHESLHDNSDVIVESLSKSIGNSGIVVNSVSISDGSVFFLKDTALKIGKVSGAMMTFKNVQANISDPKKLSTLKIAGGNNYIISDAELDVEFSVQLTEGGNVSVLSPSTSINGVIFGEGNVAFYNVEIGDNASIQHTGDSLIELKSEQGLSDAIAGRGNSGRIANDGHVNFKVNGEFRISANDTEDELSLLSSESPYREKQDVGIIADSIDICRGWVRKKGIQLLAVKDDVVVRKSITSLDGSVIINAKHGNVLIEDTVEKATIVTKCLLETKSSPVVGKLSRLESSVGPLVSSTYNLIVLDGVEVVQKVEKVELIAKDSVVISASEGTIELDPCVIHGDESVVLEGREGVLIKDVIVASVTRKNSRNPFFYCKRRKVIKRIVETTSITTTNSNGDISIISDSGSISTSGTNLTSNGGRIILRGRGGIYNKSVVTQTSISEKVHILGGLSQEQRWESHDMETPCVFQSAEGIYMASERGSIVNVGTLAMGNGVCSFKAENILFERRILKHEVSVKKKGFELSLSILGVDIFENSSHFFENLRMEFLENHLPPIGNSPIEVARSIKNGNVPEIVANFANAVLIPGNLRFILDSPVKFGLKFLDYDLHRHRYDTLGEGQVEADFLYINAGEEGDVEFSNAFGFNAGRVEIEAGRLIEKGAFLDYELENFSSGLGVGYFEPSGNSSSILECYVPSLSFDLSVAKEQCSLAVCHIGNTAFLKVNVDEWVKLGSQTFAETVEGNVGSVVFESSSLVSERKMHGISLGTSSLGLSDGNSKSSLIADQTGLYSVNVDDFHVRSVFLKSSRFPVRGEVDTFAEESIEFENVSGTSLGVDFVNFISLGTKAINNVLGDGSKITKLTGVGIEKKDYIAVVQNSFENVSESEFYYRANDLSHQNGGDDERNLEKIRDNHGSMLTRKDNTFDKVEAGGGENDESYYNNNNNRLLLTQPVKKVMKNRGFNINFHYDREYHILQIDIAKMHKEVVDDGLLPCLDDVSLFGDVDVQLLYPVLNIFYDQSTSDLDKFTQILFYGHGDEPKYYCDLTEDEKHEVFIYQSYLEEGGDFRDYTSLCSFYEEKKQQLNEEYTMKSMKDYVRETYPEVYLGTGLHTLQNVEEVRRVFMDIKFAFEPDDPMVRQMTFEMDQYIAEQLYNSVSLVELSSAQQKEIVRIREHALMYQQQTVADDQNFSEYLNAKETQFTEYFANYHQEPDTNHLTSCGILPVELLKDESPLFSECMSYYKAQPQFENERKYPVPGSGLFFLPAPPDKSGWEGICEYGSTIRNCFSDHISYVLAGKPSIDYIPSQREMYIDKSIRSFISCVLDFVPYVNGAKWSFQGIAGYDPITKDTLDWKERVIDITFSMFYFPPVASVITGYGKGAVWEPLKGTWNVGKIIVRERTMNGVLETMKATGTAIIESIALPTQHLGMFLEMKLLWGVSSGTSSLRNAGVWFSNKMEHWKAGFWSKWKWSRRQFDVMATRFPTAISSGGNFAFVGGVPSSSLAVQHLHPHNQPLSMRYAKNDQSRSVFKTGIAEDYSVYNKSKSSDIAITKREKVEKVQPLRILEEVRKTEMYIRKTPPMEKSAKNYLLKLFTEKLYEKLVIKQWEWSRTTPVRNLPSLSFAEYEAIAKRFNEEPRVNDKKRNLRNVRQVKRFRAAHVQEIMRMVQERIAKFPRNTPNVAGLQSNMLIKGERRTFLVEMISEKIIEKLNCNVLPNEMKKRSFLRLPPLSNRDYEAIANRFNAETMMNGKSSPSIKMKKTLEQVKCFRTRATRDIQRTIIRMLEKTQSELGVVGAKGVPAIRSFLQSEHRAMLVDLISERLFSKVRVLSESGGKRELHRLPMLSRSDYRAIAKRYNGDPKVCEKPQFKRSGLQVFYFSKERRRIEEIHRNVSERLEKNQHINCRLMPLEHNSNNQKIATPLRVDNANRKLLIELLADKLVEKIHDSGARKIRRLPHLKAGDYEVVMKRFNGEPSVVSNPNDQKTVKQIRHFRIKATEEIRRDVMGRTFYFTNDIKLAKRNYRCRPEHRKILVELISKKICEKARARQKSGVVDVLYSSSGKSKIKTRRFPILSQGDYKEIAKRYNAEPIVSEKFRKTAEDVKMIRYTSAKKLILKTIQERIVRPDMTVIQYPKPIPLQAEQRKFLFDLLSDKLFEKARVLPESWNGGIRRLPPLSDSEYESITKVFNAEMSTVMNGSEKNVRNSKQIQHFRNKIRIELYRKIQERIDARNSMAGINVE